MDRLLSRETFRVTRQEDSLALARGLWLHNESLVTLLINLRKEFFEVGWQVERRWEKIVFVRKDRLQAH